MEDRYIAAIVLHALGDTIGFKNGDWEFNYNKNFITLDTTNELLYEFIELGGINAIDLKGWLVSDDTIIHLCMMRALTSFDKKEIINENMIIKYKEELVNAYNDMTDDEVNKKIFRHPGVTTNKYIRQFEKGHDGRDLPYDDRAGGNGAAMRTNCLGLVYYGENNRDKLIQISIETSKLTHNNAIGYLGGLTSALFTAFAIENIDILKWPFMLVDLLKSDRVKKYMTNDDPNEVNDYDSYSNYWRKYIDSKFEDGKIIITRAQANIIFRSRFYYENFTRGTKALLIGESGFCATIMAYDCLVDAKNVWEKLIIYSALHFGDSDTVAAISASWYGALYGFGDVPEKNLKYLEFKKELIKFGTELFLTR